MAIMNRNVNLEEINTDAFMGISYLNHQTLPQKVVFIAGIVVGVGLNLLNSFVWNMSPFISLALTLVPLLLGIAFGCNYNEDLTLIKYFSLIVSNPVKHYTSKPQEDLEQLRKKAEDIKREEEEKKAKAAQISDEAQRRLLKTMLIVGILFIVGIIVAVVIINSLKVEEIHHTVSASSYGINKVIGEFA